MEELIKDSRNVYADNIRGISIHVSEAESGRNGYFCQGCKKQLEAVKSKIPGRVHFFRHVPIDKKTGERPCVYSDETYRHKLAKQILVRLKQIQLPAVYKFPPKGIQATANLLKETHLFTAHSVEIEKVFYETESGDIKMGNNDIGVDEKYLVVRPDVTFLNADGIPILFIEIVATHKVNHEKKAKLRRLGINTVEVRIPKDSPEAIEACFLNVDKIKWIYNYDESRAEYISLPTGNTKPVLQIDDEQRKLLDETFECRQAEVRNLIRTIGRILESKQYLSIDLAIGKELQRLEGNATEHKSRLDELRERHRNSVIDKLRERRENIKRTRERIENEEAEFESEETDLEARYFAKKRELDKTTVGIKKEIEYVERELSGDTSQTGSIESAIKRRNQTTRNSQDEFSKRIEHEAIEIAEIEREENQLTEYFRRKEKNELEPIEAIARNAEKEIERIEKDINDPRADFEGEIVAISGIFGQKEEDLSTEFRTKGEQLDGKFENLRKQSLQAIESRTGGGSADFAYRIRRLLEARRLFDNISKIQWDYKRNRTAWESFKQGAYKDWIK